MHATSVASEGVAKTRVTGSVSRASDDEPLQNGELNAAYPTTHLTQWVPGDKGDDRFETWEKSTPPMARPASSDMKGEPLFFPTQNVEESFPTESSDMVLGTQSLVGLIVYCLGSWQLNSSRFFITEGQQGVQGLKLASVIEQ